jgi:hypothetical protein
MLSSSFAMSIWTNPIVVILLGLLSFFLVRLVKKLDRVATSTTQMRESILELRGELEADKRSNTNHFDDYERRVEVLEKKIFNL